MTLLLELHDGERWKTIGRVEPGDRPGSVSHNPPSSPREILTFHAEPDRSIITRSVGGIDFTAGSYRVTASRAATVATLTTGEPCHEMWLRTDGMPALRRFRFRHETLLFPEPGLSRHGGRAAGRHEQAARLPRSTRKGEDHG